jgi:hypothetical protein
MNMLKKVILCLLAAWVAGSAQTVNCLVAVVNGQAVTLTDVQIVAEFGLFPRERDVPGQDPRFAALESILDRKVVLEMAREPRGVASEDLGRALELLRESQTAEEFSRKLRKFGLQESDLFPFLEERILFERAIALRFSQDIPVSRTEMEKYYREVYVPEHSRAGAAPPLEDVANVVQTRVRERTRARQVADWIRNLRSRAEIRIKKDCLK